MPLPGRATGSGPALAVDPVQNNAFRAMNRAWREGGQVRFDGGRYVITGVGDGAMNVTLGEREAMFETDRGRLTVRIIDATFPNYRQLLPDEYPSTLEVFDVCERTGAWAPLVVDLPQGGEVRVTLANALTCSFTLSLTSHSLSHALSHLLARSLTLILSLTHSH